MRRDWPLVAAGFGIAAIGAVFVAIMLLGYKFEPGTVRRPCPPPEPPAALADGCGLVRKPFGEWLLQPGMFVGYAIALVLLAIAAETIRRGLARSGRPAPRRA